MPLFGAHMSIAGGFYKAIEAACAYQMDTVQLFTASPSQWSVSELPPAKKTGKSSGPLWASKALDPREIERFRAALKESNLRFPTAHDSYLINLASPVEAVYERSIAAFEVELVRAEALGLKYLVMHPGATVGSDEDAGLARIVIALDRVHKVHRDLQVQVLLETTAGQGSTLGHRFEHLATILNQVKQPDRLGVCVDTCHILAAGYPIHTEVGYRETFEAFDRIVGLKHLKLFHVNDSKKPLGSRVDRHEHLGQGAIGIEPFRWLVTDDRFQDLPMILETPKERDDNDEMDRVNLDLLRKFLRKQRK